VSKDFMKIYVLNKDNDKNILFMEQRRIKFQENKNVQNHASSIRLIINFMRIKNVKILVSLVCLFFSINTYSQRPQQFTKGGNIIMGKVVDANDDTPIEFATVAVLRLKDSSVVSIATSTGDGTFTVENVPQGQYKLKISFVGYKNYLDTLNIGTAPIKLGTIKIQPVTEQIGEVVVKGERPMIESKIDRKIFNVDKNILAQSGNAADVLQQVPSVQVDAEGNVSLRGSENVNILINGKPSTIDKATLLQQLPANTINRIEVITNPSAKYDPEGTGGIINIVLKDGAGTGTYGSISANASTNNTYNANASFSYNPGKLAISGSYSFRDNNRESNGWVKRQYLYDLSTHNTNNDYDMNRISHMGRLNFDYLFTRLFSAGIGGSINSANRNGDGTVRYTDIVNNYVNLWNRTSDEKEDMLRSEINAYMLQKFNTDGHELKIEYTYNIEDEDENNRYSNYFTKNDSLFGDEKENNSSSNYRHTIEADYTWPINEKLKLELGAKIMFLKTENDLNGWLYDFNAITFIADTNKTSAFYYNENIYAGYGTFSYSGDKIGLMAGLRYEYFTNKFHIKDDPSYSNNFPAFFPTIHTSYKFNENNELTLSYSRRVNRPRSRMINPFPDYSDPQNMQVGNPHLRPEYINSFELGYNWKWNKWNIQPNVFYRYTDNMFSRLEVVDTIRNINISSFENSKKSSSFGTEISITYQPLKFWFINAGLSLYQMELNATNLNNSVKQKFGYNGKIMSNTMLPNGFAIQLSAFYRSPFITPQGESDPFYAVNLGLRKEFFKRKLTGLLSFNDIFHSMHFGMKMNSDQQIGEMYNISNSQAVSFGLTYKFGNNNNHEKKKQDNNNQNEQTDDYNNMMMN
jgi:outer membrane receptor protein involved in Fe transport